MIDDDREEQLRSGQDGRLYPLGRVLRSTFDADNHDTLDRDVTGLMIDLSKVPFERDMPPAARPAAIEPGLGEAAGTPLPRSWRTRLGGMLARAATRPV